MARHPYLGAGSQGIPKSEDRTVVEKKPPANHIYHHHPPTPQIGKSQRKFEGCDTLKVTMAATKPKQSSVSDYIDSAPKFNIRRRGIPFFSSVALQKLFSIQTNFLRQKKQKQNKTKKHHYHHHHHHHNKTLLREEIYRKRLRNDLDVGTIREGI